MTDVLAPLSPPQVAAFYRRLAKAVQDRRGSLKVSLSALLMNHWLDNRVRNSVFSFDPPAHLTSHARVLGALAYHRAVYLTEEKARLAQGKERWAGVVPRLQGKAPYKKWEGVGLLSMDYQSLVEFPLRYQLTGNDADRDLLYALHGFQLKTYAIVTGQPSPVPQRVRVGFQVLQGEILDRYDWNYSEHLTVPNPDFGSTAPGAVAPRSQTVVVYHKHAKRIEDANLAAPYDIKTKRWLVTDPDLLAAADVDPTRSL